MQQTITSPQVQALARVEIEEIDAEARAAAEEFAAERFDALCNLSDEEMDRMAAEWEAMTADAPF